MTYLQHKTEYEKSGDINIPRYMASLIQEYKNDPKFEPVSGNLPLMRIQDPHCRELLKYLYENNIPLSSKIFVKGNPKMVENFMQKSFSNEDIWDQFYNFTMNEENLKKTSVLSFKATLLKNKAALLKNASGDEYKKLEILARTMRFINYETSWQIHHHLVKKYPPRKNESVGEWRERLENYYPSQLVYRDCLAELVEQLYENCGNKAYFRGLFTVYYATRNQMHNLDLAFTNSDLIFLRKSLLGSFDFHSMKPWEDRFGIGDFEAYISQVVGEIAPDITKYVNLVKKGTNVSEIDKIENYIKTCLVWRKQDNANNELYKLFNQALQTRYEKSYLDNENAFEINMIK